MKTLQEWHLRIEAEHLAEVERGEHDDECESRPRSRLCHCSKRRRIAAGHGELPGELIFNSPSCPRCWGDAHHDGDGFVCETCKVSWSNNGVDAHFYDDYGDLSVGPAEGAG